MSRNPTARRAFLRFLASSPLALADEFRLRSPADALNVTDLEAAARAALPPAHFGYLATGVEGDVTVRANIAGFERWAIRPRRLVDVADVDLRVELFGSSLPHPVLLAPTGSQRAFHADGEVGTARAAKTKDAQMILSTVTTSRIEDVFAAGGRPSWFQLYPADRGEVMAELVRRAESAGSPAVVLTVDSLGGRKTETAARAKRLDTRDCTACHSTEPGGFFHRKPMFAGIKMGGVALTNPRLTWDSVRRLRDVVRGRLLLKGIQTGEDAALCPAAGIDGIIVSNHGGRAEDSGWATIASLPEVVAAAGERMPVLIDGGIRRGTDIFKAIALGARAVCIGRPYLWGLAAFGQPGVEQAIEILRQELTLICRQSGTPRLSAIARSQVTPVNG